MGLKASSTNRSASRLAGAAASTDQTLSEALELLGIQHEPSEVEGKRDWYTRSGEYLGAYDAHEGWVKLKAIVAMVQAAGDRTAPATRSADT